MIWIVMVVAGLITYSTRFSMFNKSIAEKMPKWVEVPLHYVPIALLTAIIVPEVLIYEQNLSLSIFENFIINIMFNINSLDNCFNNPIGFTDFIEIIIYITNINIINF